MANSLVVRKGTDLAKRIRALRAAQYMRMSTDLQRYSIANQAAVAFSVPIPISPVERWKVHCSRRRRFGPTQRRGPWRRFTSFRHRARKERA